MFNSKKKNAEKTYGVIGLGRFGTALAIELAAAGAEIIVMDKSEEKVREMREYTDNAFVVKNLDKKTLAETGVQNCDVAIVCISERIDTSVLTACNLLDFKIPKVIAKASSHEHGEILKKLGAEIVFPERDMAIRLAHTLDCSQTLDYIQLSEKLNITKQLVPERIVGKTVVEANLRGKFGTNIIAIENGGSLIEVISPEYMFKAGDILFLSGDKKGLNELADWAE